MLVHTWYRTHSRKPRPGIRNAKFDFYPNMPILLIFLYVSTILQILPRRLFLGLRFLTIHLFPILFTCFKKDQDWFLRSTLRPSRPSPDLRFGRFSSSSRSSCWEWTVRWEILWPRFDVKHDRSMKESFYPQKLPKLCTGFRFNKAWFLSIF